MFGDNSKLSPKRLIFSAATIFLVAFLARLLLFIVTLDQVGTASFADATPDVSQYVEAARLIRTSGDFDSIAVTIFGPGYPIFLAALGLLVSPVPWAAILVQLVLGSLGAVFLYLFAIELTDNQYVALTAALLYALSLSSIVLANLLLSETLFFTLIIAGFWLFLKGLKDSKLWPFPVAALLFGYGALVRTVGVFLFVILLLIAAIYRLTADRITMTESSLRYYLRPGLTALVIIILLGGWVRWNVASGRRALPLATPHGQTKVFLDVRARVNNTTFYAEREKFFRHSGPDVETSGVGLDYGFTASARSAFWSTAFAHPWETIVVMVDHMVENINSSYDLSGAVVPKWYPSIAEIVRWIDKKGLNYRVSLLVLIGAGMLVYRRRWRVVGVLLLICVYFALSTAFSKFQGNRVFNAGQIASLILAAYPLCWLWERAKSLVNRRRRM
jgi:hypothetical protein